MRTCSDFLSAVMVFRLNILTCHPPEFIMHIRLQSALLYWPGGDFEACLLIREVTFSYLMLFSRQ